MTGTTETNNDASVVHACPPGDEGITPCCGRTPFELPRGPRDACPNDLHDWPLPAGYVDASEVAQRRLNSGWSNRRCPDCGLYGWGPGRLRDTDVRVAAVPDPTGDPDA